jgi:hypothetical protein
LQQQQQQLDGCIGAVLVGHMWRDEWTEKEVDNYSSLEPELPAVPSLSTFLWVYTTASVV